MAAYRSTPEPAKTRRGSARAYALSMLFLVLSISILLWLPDNAAAVGPGRVLVAALFFLVVARMPAAALVSLHGQRTLLLVTALSIGISACVVIAAIAADGKLVAVAVAASSGYFASSIPAMTAGAEAL